MCFLFFFFYSEGCFWEQRSCFQTNMVINCGAPENIWHVHFNRIIPKESDSVPMRNQDVFNSGGTFARTGSEEPCTTSWRFTDSSECSQVQHGTRSPHLGLCHTSKELLRVVSSSLCKGSSPDLHLPEAHLTKQPLPIPLPSPPGLRRSVETQNFRNSNHLPLKDDYFTLYLIEPMSGLSPLFFFFFSSFLPDSRSIKSERTRKISPWETEKTKTDLTTRRLSRPWPTWGS